MNIKTKIMFLSIFTATIFSTSLFAQRTTDIENSQDHPLISRFDKSVIEFYKETKWGSYKLPVGSKGNIDWDNPLILEGKVIRIQYTTSTDYNPEFILQNYKKAFSNSGYTLLTAIAAEELGFSERPHTWINKYYDADDFYKGLNNGKFGKGLEFPTWKKEHCFIAVKGNKAGKDIYVAVYIVADEKYNIIAQDVIEVEAAETGLVTAEEILKGITTDGHIAIYDILFDTGKSEIKQGSSDIFQIIAEFIKSNPSKKYFIVGHTDNTGNFEDNKTLAENRAKSVINELVSKYKVDKTQLSAYGVASLVPVSSNSSEEGRAKNRRVEIVEQ